MDSDFNLSNYLFELRNKKESYKVSLAIAVEFITSIGGSVKAEDDEGVTVITLGHDIAYCFQPYPDIDLFYFEY